MFAEGIVRLSRRAELAALEHKPGWNTIYTLNRTAFRYELLIGALQEKGVQPEFHSGDGDELDSYIDMPDCPVGKTSVWYPSYGWQEKQRALHAEWVPRWVIMDSLFGISVVRASANTFEIAAKVMERLYSVYSSVKGD